MFSEEFLPIFENIPQSYLVAALASSYVVFYCLKYVRKPVLYARDGGFKDYLLQNMNILQKRYWPTIWCLDGRNQTVSGHLFRLLFRKIKYEREVLVLKDGGQVALDWQVNDFSGDDIPIVVILPGLLGDSQAEYVRCLATKAKQIGVRAVVFNYRGFGVPLTVRNCKNCMNSI